MFCSKCGNQTPRGLKFCKDCGNRLGREVEDKDGTPGKMLDNILTTLFLIVMFGMGILVGLVAVLLGSGVPNPVVTVIVIAYLAVVGGICFSLVRQVPKLIDARLKPWEERNYNTASSLPPRTTAQLEEFREPIGSVTERTTRTLDEIRRD